MGDLSSLKKTESGQEVVRPFSAYNLKKNDTVKSTDKTPFLFRAIPPLSTPYVREKLVGASMAWNQLANFASAQLPSNLHSLTYTTTDEKSVTINGTADTSNRRSGWFNLGENSGFIGRTGHKVIFYSKAISGTASGTFYVSLFSTTSDGYAVGSAFVKVVPALGTDCRMSFGYTQGAAFTNYKITFDCIDLTLAFSPAIADRIYSMEQSEAGSGIAWIKSYGFFTDDYYANDSGSIQSVCADRKEIVGFNLWDEEVLLGSYNSSTGEYVSGTGKLCSKNPTPCIPNETCYFKTISGTNAGSVFFFDASGNYINYISNKGNGEFTVPANAYLIHFAFGTAYGDVYNHDICINISDTDKNGTYEPYHKTTISLGHDELRGVMQLDANNNLVYYGDEKASDGTVTRWMDFKTIGSISWTYEGDGLFSSTAIVTEKMVCADYLFVENSNIINIATAKQYLSDRQITHRYTSQYGTNDRIYLMDSRYTNTTDLKSAMSNTEIWYRLATPTTEQSTPFESPQYLFDGGTEEFIDYGVEQETRDVAVPVGHVTEYMGASEGTEIKDKFYFPTLPEKDGTYDLRCVIQSGIVKDMAWKTHSSGANISHDYSLTEQEVGTWIDGSKLYQKTLTYSGSSILITSSVWTTIPFAEVIPNISYFFHTMVTTDCSENRIRFKYDGGYLKAAAVDDLNISQLVVTIRYTKTSS